MDISYSQSSQQSARTAHDQLSRRIMDARTRATSGGSASPPPSSFPFRDFAPYNPDPRFVYPPGSAPSEPHHSSEEGGLATGGSDESRSGHDHHLTQQIETVPMLPHSSSRPPSRSRHASPDAVRPDSPSSSSADSRTMAALARDALMTERMLSGSTTDIAGGSRNSSGGSGHTDRKKRRRSRTGSGGGGRVSRGSRRGSREREEIGERKLVLRNV
jgi:hypothetical protein